jgi:hypothetical protein
MEREAEQAEQQAQDERQAIRQQEREVAQERAEAAQERQQITEDRERTQEAQQQGRITQQEAGQQQQEIERREENVQQREQEIARREENIEQRREEAQRLEEFAEQRTEQAQQHREEIARDQQAVIVQETTGGVFGVIIERTAPTTMGRLVRLNPANGREIRRSPVNTIHTRTITFLAGRAIAIAGENVRNAAVRLVEINQNTMEMARQGDDDIQTGSLLWVNGNDIYAITVDLRNNHCFISRFDTNLVQQARSSVRVHPQASVSIQQGRLLTQRDDGSPLVLNPADLTEIR